MKLKNIHTSLIATASLLSASASFAQQPAPTAGAGATVASEPAPAPAAAPAATPAPATTAEPAPVPAPVPPASNTQPYGQQYAPPPPPEPVSQDMAPNGIYAELLGPGLIYSINYERVIANMFAPRIGFGFLGGSSSSSGQTSSLISIPITVSFVGLHSGMHGFEVGAGGAVYIASNYSASPGGTNASGNAGLITALAGYRLHPVGHMGFQLRAGFEINYMFGQGSAAIFPWPYLSLGAAF